MNGKWTPEALKAIYANCNSWWEVAESVNVKTEQLRTQLAAAQAEIKAHNKHVTEMHTESSDDCYEIPLSDSTELDAVIAAAIKEVQDRLTDLEVRYDSIREKLWKTEDATKPLVDALGFIARGGCVDYTHSQQIAKDAIAQVK